MKKQKGEDFTQADRIQEILHENFTPTEGGLVVSNLEIPEELPLIELRNNVCFPYTMLPIAVGRSRTKRLVESLEGEDPLVVITAQKNPEAENPTKSGLYRVGTLAKVKQSFPVPGHTALVVVGLQRVKIVEFVQSRPYFKVAVEPLTDHFVSLDTDTVQVKLNELQHLAKRYSEFTNDNISFLSELSINKKSPIPYFIAHTLASLLEIPVDKKQEILENDDFEQRLDLLLKQIAFAIRGFELRQEIQKKTHEDLEKQQRDFMLQQQIKTLQSELNDGEANDAEVLIKKGEKLRLTKAAREVFDREINRLQQMNSAAPDYAIQLSYLQLFTDLPWGIYSKDNHDLKYARQCLDENHFGLEKVKERILEFLAVLKLKRDLKSPIICLYGPPGVGKTSLGRSVAKALGRQYARISLGGMHDEAEIRGHRRTYVGAMAGRIIQNLRKVKTANPVFVLDEIDKVTSNMMGDPASALLEVLDPEQNKTFYDNYLEVEFDLSNVLFITTANDISTIAPALRDRMEMVEITGYLLEEKVAIAKRHLIPKQLEAHGVLADQFNLSDDLIQMVIEDYTRESGVRKLDQMLAKLVRQQAKRIALEEDMNVSLTKEDIIERLGRAKFVNEHYRDRHSVGVAVGMAWTQVGGDILYVESSMSVGKGALKLTGNLGDVMKESATIALQLLRSMSGKLHLTVDFLNTDIHVHVPEGAIPKDGPSAGVTMVTSLLSTLANVVPTAGIAMTGEVTLSGRVLPVGGIKEKILAAKRADITRIVLPAENQKDIEEIKPEYIQGLTFSYINSVEELIEVMFPGMLDAESTKAQNSVSL